MMNLSLTCLTGAWIDDATFVNLGTVAFVLMILCSVLGIVYWIKQLTARPKEEDEPPVSAPVQQQMPLFPPVILPTPAEKPAKKAAKKSTPPAAPAPVVDEGAIVAVLTAAVATMLAHEAADGTVPSFRVVSFQRCSRGRRWNGNR